MTQEHLRFGIAAHLKINEFAEQFEKNEKDASARLKIVKITEEKVEHHLEDKEYLFSQLSVKVFKKKLKGDLAKKNMTSMEENK